MTGHGLPPISERLIGSMQLASEDRESLESLVRFSLGLTGELELDGFAPVVDFLMKLEAEPLEENELGDKARIKGSVTAFLSSHPKSWRPA